jgi:hypothetical protein
VGVLLAVEGVPDDELQWQELAECHKMGGSTEVTCPDMDPSLPCITGEAAYGN